MEEGYTSLPTSHLLGSVPAALVEDKKVAISNEASTADLRSSSPSNGGYQPPGGPHDADESTTTSWKGAFNISSYSPYFNVDTDVVVGRLLSSVYPMVDFYRKIDGNPDLYGPLWISTTLVFMLAAFGNVGTYLMRERTEPNVSWIFDVNYLNWAACFMFGYTFAVPVAMYFLLQYLGCSKNLICLWCMWGYSLTIFMPTCLLLVVPVEIFRWIIIVLAGSASAWFIAANLKAYTQANDLMALVASATILQFALALFIKIFFFA